MDQQAVDDIRPPQSFYSWECRNRRRHLVSYLTVQWIPDGGGSVRSGYEFKIRIYCRCFNRHKKFERPCIGGYDTAEVDIKFQMVVGNPSRSLQFGHIHT